MKHFRLWLEARIDRETAKKIVLDAVGAGDANDETRQSVLGSKLSEQPKLMQSLAKYSILAPHMNVLVSYIQTHQGSNLIDLIDYMQQLDAGEES